MNKKASLDLFGQVRSDLVSDLKEAIKCEIGLLSIKVTVKNSGGKITDLENENEELGCRLQKYQITYKFKLFF